MDADRGITITPEFQRDYVPGSHDAFRIRLTASQAVDMPPEIFAYRALPLQPGQAERLGFFSHVCSPVDLDEFPVAAPRPNDTPPWFRLDSVDMLLRSRAEADDFFASVLEEVDNLIASMNAAETLVTQAPVRLGAAWATETGPDESSESSFYA